MSFVDTWNYIQNNLGLGMSIDNWTKDNQYIGDPFEISNVSSTHIDIKIPKQHVPQIDFQGVYDIWPQYISGTYLRSEIRDNITRYSKFIISILKWVESSNGGTLL